MNMMLDGDAKSTLKQQEATAVKEEKITKKGKKNKNANP
jgi:hypothetical protein